MTRNHLGWLLAIGILAGCAPVAPMVPAPQPAPAQVGAASFTEFKRAMGQVYERYLKGFDQNGDGLLTSTEARFASPSDFARMDTNKDGRLDLSELLASISKPEYTQFKSWTGDLFKQLDTDRNGVITLDKFTNEAFPLGTPASQVLAFRLGDRNRDGKLAYAEFENAVAWLYAAGHVDQLPVYADPAAPPTYVNPALPPAQRGY